MSTLYVCAHQRKRILKRKKTEQEAEIRDFESGGNAKKMLSEECTKLGGANRLLIFKPNTPDSLMH